MRDIIAAVSAAFLALLLLAGVALSQDTYLPPCATEDSDNCYWDADTMGNNRGTDSVVVSP